MISKIALFCMIYLGANWVGLDRAEAQQALYLGTEASDIQVTIRDTGARLRSEDFACANCHGLGGEGGAEGQVVATGLLPQIDSMAPYRSNVAAFRRAVREGVSFDGRLLHKAMPSYDLSEQQAYDLSDYLVQLEQAESAGLDGKIKIGVVSDRRSHENVEAEFRDAVKSVNVEHGIWGEKLELVPLATQDSSEVAGLSILVGGIAWHNTSPADLMSSPIHLPDISFVAGSKTNRVFALVAPVASQFDALRERLGVFSEKNCYILAGSDILSQTLLKEWLKPRNAGTGQPCKLLDDNEPTSGPAIVLALTASGADLARLQKQFSPESTQVFGLLDVLLPFARQLKEKGYKLVLADPHSDMTENAMFSRQNIRTVRLAAAIGAVAMGAKLAGRQAKRQELLNAMRSNRLASPVVKLLEF